MNSLESQMKSLVNFLAKHKLRYVILGGIAVSIYGQPRFTADIDVNVLLGSMGIGEFLSKSKQYGFYPLLPNAEKIARKTGVIPLRWRRGNAKGNCDIIIAENIIEFAAIKRGRVKKIGDIKTRVVTAEDLIIHKITSSRPRDIEDLKNILFRQRGKLNLKYIRSWLKKIDKANRKSRLNRLFDKLLTQ